MVHFWQYLVFLDLVLAICDRFKTNVKKNCELTKMKKVTF